MHKVGHDTSVLSAKKDSQHREPKVSGADIMRASMISDANSSALQPVGKSDRLHAGVNDGMLRSKAERIAKLSRRARNLDARVGESDRRIYDEMPKHLNSGKRGIGKTQRR